MSPYVPWNVARTLFLAVGLISGAAAAAEVGPNSLQPDVRASRPEVAAASNEGEQAIRRFRVPPGYKVELFAAEPMLANPVAFTIDAQGRIYTSETYRYRSSVLDIRHYMAWLEDDLASRNNEDRLGMLKKFLGPKIADLGVETEVIRLIEDTNGDGRADKSTVFADGFTNILDGIASGVLARKGEVFFANIPKLWRLKDTNGDGKADTRDSMSEGYGVHYNYTGHDLHGLILGPDGRLYFSIGDRGAHVRTREGRTLDLPDEGAVFRCNLDGSELEVFARGLRNPQELAFDQHGNLFTGDNDSDQGDRERWVYVMEGSDSGWRIGYQHNPLGNAGPWNFEKLWWPTHEGQPAYITPPIVNIDNGPSGLVYNYGTGLPPELENHFFLCHFKGASSNSRITSYRLRSNGAGFELDRSAELMGDILPTDVEIGPDGALYFSDWHQGWPKSAKGRIYRVIHSASHRDPVVAETRQLLSEGMDSSSLAKLGRLLGHRDMRVRAEAQFALVARGQAGLAPLLAAASTPGNVLTRLHGIWGAGQLGRSDGSAVQPLVPLLEDPEVEVRAHAARVLGEAKFRAALRPLIKLLEDPSSRVRSFAAMALGHLGDKTATSPLLRLARENADQDPFLRHAAVASLSKLNDGPALRSAASDSSPSVRLVSLLAMRQLRHPEIEIFLKDPEPWIVAEAARAINDVPVNEALPALAALADGRVDSLSLGYRAVNANYRLGSTDAANRLASYAARSDVPAETRVEALRCLGSWQNPFPRDRVVGVYRPLPARDPASAVQALARVLPRLLKQNAEPVLAAAAQACVRLKIESSSELLAELLATKTAPVGARVEALHSLGALMPPNFSELLSKAFGDDEEAVRREATRLQARAKTGNAFQNLKSVLSRGSVGEKQDALIALGDLPDPGVDEVLMSYLDTLAAGTLPAALRWDVLETATRREAASIKVKLASYKESLPKEYAEAASRDLLEGGDASEGKRIFFERQDVACLRCHQVNGEGGEVGPVLTGFGARQNRDYILEAILFPNKHIAPGFENVMLTLNDGRDYAGVVKSETATELIVNSPEDGLLTLKKSEIQARHKGLSGMPEEMGKILSPRDLRNLVEYLASLK